MNILITGGIGFIGTYTAKALKEHNITFYDEVDRDNILDFDQLLHKLKGIDLVYHFASLKNVQESIEKPNYYHIKNVVGTSTLLEAMLHHNITRIIFSSSAAVYDESDKAIKENSKLKPVTPYGENKRDIETLLKDFDYTILRYFNVVGDHPNANGLVQIAQNCLKEDKEINVYGNSIRDYIHINDVVEANIQALNWNKQTVNIGRGIEVSTMDIINKIGVKYKQCPELQEIKKSVADITKAKSLGWQFRYDII